MIHKDEEITSTLSVLYCAMSTLYFSLAADSDYPQISCQISPSWYCSTHPMTQHMLLPWTPITSFLKHNLSNLWICGFQLGELRAAYPTCLLNISPEWPWCLPTQNLCLLGEGKDVTLDVKLICFLQKTDSPARERTWQKENWYLQEFHKPAIVMQRNFRGSLQPVVPGAYVSLWLHVLYPDNLHFLVM